MRMPMSHYLLNFFKFYVLLLIQFFKAIINNQKKINIKKINISNNKNIKQIYLCILLTLLHLLLLIILLKQIVSNMMFINLYIVNKILTQKDLPMKSQGYQNIEQQQKKGAFNIPYEQIKCKKQNKSQNICMNINCLKDSLICADKLCECNQYHQDCITIVLQKFIKSIQSKSILLKPIQQLICSRIQKTIDQLSDFRDEMIIKLRQKFQYVGLTEQQKTILQAFKKGNFDDKSGDVDKINGKMIWNVVNFNFQKSDRTNKLLKQLQEQIGELWKKLNNEIKSTTQSILSSFQDFKQIITDGPRAQKLFKNSKVILTKQQEINLTNFFNFFKVEKAKLLFRASQNQFDTSKFHQKCDNVPHTLCIAQTQFGKILGGYTPLRWCTSQNSYTKDQSGRSFLFSLTSNDKFQLVAKGHAIYIRKDYGPTFGSGHNFLINNKSNIGGPNDSYFNIYPGIYINSKYPSASKQAYQKLSGNPYNSHLFKVKQWQVWSLQLKSQ